MHKKSFLRPILLFGIITIIFASCDKDFNELGTNIVSDDHFGFDVDSTSTVKAYNQKLGPIASNNLPINPLGFYSNPVQKMAYKLIDKGWVEFLIIGPPATNAAVASLMTLTKNSQMNRVAVMKGRYSLIGWRKIFE